MRRWILVLVLGALACIAYGVYSVSEERLTRRYSTGPAPSLAGGDSARGAHLVNVVSLCTQCHAADLGGRVLSENAAFLVAPPNLTRGAGGRPANWSDADWNRAIRHGIGGDGEPLFVMPADVFSTMSNEDLRAVVAYIRSMPAVDRQVPPTRVKLLGRLIALSDEFDELAAERIRHELAPPEHAEPGDGAYLTRIAGCTFCHGGDFAGRTRAVAPPPAPLPPRINDLARRGWTLADFSNAVRHGVRPDGRVLKGLMPWSTFAGMTDAEIAALWLETQRADVRARAMGR